MDCIAEMLGAKRPHKEAASTARAHHKSPLVRAWRRIWKRPQRTTPTGLPSVRGPAGVVTGGGMCDGGCVLDHLALVGEDSSNIVALTGYSSPATNAGQLVSLASVSNSDRRGASGHLDLGRHGKRPLATFRARVENISGYSAHADRAGLIDWFAGAGRERQVAPTVFLSHGDSGARESLARGLMERCGAGLDVQRPVPVDGWFDLDAGDWIDTEVDQVSGLTRENRRLELEVARLRSHVDVLEGRCPAPPRPVSERDDS